MRLSTLTVVVFVGHTIAAPLPISISFDGVQELVNRAGDTPSPPSPPTHLTIRLHIGTSKPGQTRVKRRESHPTRRAEPPTQTSIGSAFQQIAVAAANANAGTSQSHIRILGYHRAADPLLRLHGLEKE
jgi:hypothetical protein